MCLSKLFGNSTSEPMKPVERRLLTFGKNVYPGGNSLRGCVHDSQNLSKKLTGSFSDFDVRMFLDGQATAANYLSKIAEAKRLLSPGATILVMMDSCFSGTGTRLYSPNPNKIIKNRFLDPGLPQTTKVRSKILMGTDITWIAMSGGGEHQTCADAYINGQYVGAFTDYAILAIRKGMTYREWHYEISKYLPGSGFDQAPEIEGLDYLLGRKLFEGQTLVIHNSSHGSWTVDKHGDEADGRDEGIYLDRLIIDDEISKLLNAA